MTFALFAQLDLFNLPAAFYLGVRFVVAVVAGLVGFLLVAPIFGVLYQVMSRKELPRLGEHVVRLAGTIGLGLAAWYLLPIGAGLGPGLGPGQGPGKGPGEGGQTHDSTNGSAKNETKKE